ncbi:hypothetical protein ScoT_33930 [Streptomyces albidoflavus]|uniref:Uncharacterized protein n=1 Tax=Streptomyces albidoflavus TaxID=1886 RepID=A0AA37C246_9ACTN|nr:hypothetical protein ScoT_33930 [Streptomyces albidoflavus]
MKNELLATRNPTTPETIPGDGRRRGRGTAALQERPDSGTAGLRNVWAPEQPDTKAGWALMISAQPEKISPSGA